MPSLPKSKSVSRHPKIEYTEGWMKLTANTVRVTGDQVGYWWRSPDGTFIWLVEYACDTSSSDLLDKYGFTHYRRMNPPPKER